VKSEIDPKEKDPLDRCDPKVVLEHEKKIDEKSKDGRAFMPASIKSLGRDYDKKS
jgi:hypothetical protein